MATARADYTLTFRGLPQTDEDWLFLFGTARAEALAWRDRYRARMDGEGDQVRGHERGQSQICAAQLGGRNRHPRRGRPERYRRRWTAS